MFYCDPRKKKNGWPENFLFKSYGLCEACKKNAVCNDVPSKYLPSRKGRAIPG